MLVDQQKFIAWVRRLYLADPGAVSSIAWRKLKNMLRECGTHQIDSELGKALYAVRHNQLLFYWSDQAERWLLPPEEMAQLDFLVLHESYYPLVAAELRGFTLDVTYPLFYDHSRSFTRRLSTLYRLVPFDFGQSSDFAAAAEIINRTNSGYLVSPQRLRRWTEEQGFDPSLWVFAKEPCSDAAVGIAISCYDPELQETDLDWFFVHPDHQGQGVGRLLVEETLARCLPKSHLVRVSGIADEFYLKCGFQRHHKWIILRRE
jgi:GNAT superfamily N-acetyltransferase